MLGFPGLQYSSGEGGFSCFLLRGPSLLRISYYKRFWESGKAYFCLTLNKPFASLSQLANVPSAVWRTDITQQGTILRSWSSHGLGVNNSRASYLPGYPPENEHGTTKLNWWLWGFMLNLFWVLMFSWFTCTSMMLGTEVCRSCASQKRTLSQCISESLADVGFQRSGPLFTLTFGTSPRCVGMQIGNCYCWGRRWLCLSCGHIMGQIKYRRNVPGILNATWKFMQVWTVVFFVDMPWYTLLMAIGKMLSIFCLAPFFVATVSGLFWQPTCL